MGALVEVLDVSLAERDGELLAGCSIDVPRSGARSDSYALDVQGWIAANGAPAVAVELSRGGGKPWPLGGLRPWQVPLDVDRSQVAAAHPELDSAAIRGFHTAVNSLRLPPDFELTLHAVLSDETRIEVASIRGRRARLRSGFEPRIQPISLTTIGRTGTTMLTTLLGAHPEVLVYRPFVYEPAVAGYWLQVLRAFSDPASYVRQVIPPLPRKEAWWTGTTPLTGHRNIVDPALETWIGVQGVEAMAAFCQSRIEALYEEVARQARRGRPAYFAEKYEPGWVPEFMWELYPRAREVFVVRDFRDVVCSILAFNVKRRFESFGRQRFETDEQFVEWLGQSASRLLESWERRRDRALLLRYEDMVREPSESLEGVLRYLDVDASESTIEAMLASLAEKAPAVEEHRTSLDQEASIGRWRSELSPELARASERVFGPALEAFGYA